MGVRRRARETALRVLYGCEFEPRSPAEALDLYLEHFCPEGRAGRRGPMEVYALRLVEGVRAHGEEIDGWISRASRNWRIDRMALVDRNILRLAAFELGFVPEVPRKVALNEAVEVAKRYGTADSSAFVNGILDRIAQWVRPT